MPDVLFRFVTQAASLAQKRCAASPTAVVSDLAGNGFADGKHLTQHFLRVHMDASYAEIVDWASEMDRVCAVLYATFESALDMLGRMYDDGKPPLR